MECFKYYRYESYVFCHYDFNQDISKWNVSNVIDMRFMFANYKKFNQNISKWNVQNVQNMSYMFIYCYNFNQNISKWNISNITNIRDIKNMFYGCKNNKNTKMEIN